MARIDKIKLKKEKNKIINLDVSSLDVKMDRSFSNKDQDWILLPDIRGVGVINIKSLFKQNNKSNFMLEIRHYLKIRRLALSHSTVVHDYKSLRHFILKFLNNEKLTISSFSDINYDVLLKYSEFIRCENTNTSIYYKTIIKILNNVEKINEISVSNDVLKRNYPNVKLPQNKTKSNIPYNEKEFIQLSKLVKGMIKLYFNEGSKNKALFVKSAYWYIAMFTGFNATGMNSLNEDSFNLVSGDKGDLFYVNCIKNRSKFGSQTMTIPLSNENELFLKVFNELKNIRAEIKSSNSNIFSYINNDNIFEYLGRPMDFHNLCAVRKHITENNLKNIRILSTLNIRQFFSTKMMDNTKFELLVSKMMGHNNVKTTEKHYMKHQVNPELKFKFNIVQNLMNSFSNNNDFSDWVIFQNTFGISELTLEEIHFKIKNGHFDNAIGKCIKDSDYKEDKCGSYLNCLSCKNFSIVGEIDLWKIISFKESLIKNCEKIKINWIVEIIENTIKEIDIDLIMLVRNRILKNGLYPFWKNELMVKTIVEGYINE
jgi:hypothetical protein